MRALFDQMQKNHLFININLQPKYFSHALPSDTHF